MSNRFKVFLSLAFLYALLIFYLSSRPSLGDPKAIYDFLHLESLRSILRPIEHSDIRFLLYPLSIFSKYPDKIMHIILYAGFGLLLYLTLKNSSNPTLRNHVFIFAVILGILYGASDELHQSFVPGRTVSIWDLLADSIGVAIAPAVVFIKNRLRPLISPKKGIHHLDLKLAIILIILSIIFILIPPFNQTFLRMIVALPLLLFLPGYLLISVMFPKQGELSPIERFTLSIGLSIAIFVFDGFALNYTRWGFRPNSIVISLSIIMGLLLIAAYLQRWRLGEAGYGFSFRDITSFYQTIRSKETETGPEYDPALEKMLIKTMIIAIFIVSAMLIYAYATREPEKFTAFYILGSKGKAEDYPGEVYINKPTQLLVGIENYEHQPANYTLRVKLGDKTLKEQQVYLKHEGKWLENVTFTPRITSSIALASAETRTKLEFLLLKDGIPHRSVHLWVKPIFDIKDFTPTIILANGDMEQASGWNFTSTSENITGTYTNDTWVSPLHSYEINFTSNTTREYGELYQNITVDREAIASISFYVRDSSSNTSANISKQVLLDSSVVWEAGVGNKSWEKIQVPLFFSKNTRLAFKVYNKIPVNNTVQVWWDEIKIEPYTNISAKPIPRPIVVEYYPQLEFNIRGMPFAMKGNATLNGGNFPGFNYNIDENKSYEKLVLVFSDNSTIEAGNATYISTMHGDEISLIGSKYKIINKKDIGLLSKVLVKNASKTLNLSEKWSLSNDYALSLKLVSSKGDTAMLELWKSSRLLDTKLLGRGGIFEYRATIAKNTTTIFKTKIETITLDSVKVKETELYSDTPTIFKVGDSIGDFEVTNISSTEIVMKNPYPIKINEGTLILSGSIRFRVIEDLAFPYSASGENRGIPQTILPGSLMDINGLNYPGFYYDLENKISLEELSMYFTYNATVDIGKAIYKTKSHGNELSFLGDSYWLPYKRVNMISGFSTIRKTIPKNGSLGLENGYTLTLKEKPENLFEITVRKNMTKSERELLNKTNYSRFFKDLYYEIFVNRSGTLIKSNTMQEGEEFEYWIEYEEDKKYKLFSGEIEALDNENVTIEIRQYQKPKELLPGMIYGEFEVEYITSDTISLKNTKPINLEPGKETPILGGAIRIRTSAKEPIAYPMGST